MAKPTRTGVGGSGVFAAVRDLFAIYKGKTIVNADGVPVNLADDGTVAILAADANEIAVAVDIEGNACATTAALGTTTYTSGIFLTQGFARIIGSVFSNSNGTLHIQQSSDGVNFDSDQTVAVTGNTGTQFSFEIIAPYARLQYVPTASQATFRLFPFLRRI